MWLESGLSFSLKPVYMIGLLCCFPVHGARWQGGRRVEARGKKEDSQRGGVGGCAVLDAAGL